MCRHCCVWQRMSVRVPSVLKTRLRVVCACTRAPVTNKGLQARATMVSLCAWQAIRAGNIDMSQPYRFAVPPTWREGKIANIQSGNFCLPRCGTSLLGFLAMLRARGLLLGSRQHGASTLCIFQRRRALDRGVV